MSGQAWVILPTYDEGATIERVVEWIRSELAAVPEGFRILVVDDASPDGTGAFADRLAARNREVEVLHRERKYGLGSAYVAGFEHALARGAAYVVEMDADLSHDPADLPRLLARARAGADVVVGSRYVAGGGASDWTLLRRAVSALGCWYARTILHLPVRDLTSGFKCFRAEALHATGYRSARARGYGFQVELTYRAVAAGCRVEEIPIVFSDRLEGRSKMTPGIALEAAWRVLALAYERDAAKSITAASSSEPAKSARRFRRQRTGAAHRTSAQAVPSTAPPSTSLR